MARDDDMMTPDDNASDELVPTWTADGHVDEGTIHTWLDGAFDDAQSAIVTAHVDGCSSCREAVAEARGFIAGASRMVRALDAVPADVVEPADVERAAARIVAAAVSDVPRMAARPERVRRAWYDRPAIRAAAAILVIVTGGTYVWSRTPPMTTKESSAGAPTSDAPAVLPQQAPVAAAESKPNTPPLSLRAPSTNAAPSLKARVDAPVRESALSASKAATAVPGVSVASSEAVRSQVAADASMAMSPAPPRAMIDSARVVTGHITTASGAPAVGVQLSATGRVSTRTVTDSAGAYRLIVAGDSVVLLARQLGFAPKREVVDLRRRDSARVDMKMEPSVMALNSVTVTSGPPISARVLDAPASIATVGGATMGGLVQSNIVVRELCWSVQANGAPAFRLPTHLSARETVDGLPRTAWINWPSKRDVTYVEMSSASSGEVTGSSVAGRDTLLLTLTPRGKDWTGIAMHSDGTKRIERTIMLKHSSDSVCKP